MSDMYDSYLAAEGGGYAETVTEAIIKQIENGTAKFIQPWVPDPEFVPDYNPVSSGDKPKPYRGINSIMLSLQRQVNDWSDPRWVTFKQAADHKWKIIKGSKASPISFFKYLEKIVPKTDRNGAPVMDESGKPAMLVRKIPSFSYYMVFNAAQVEGMPALEKAPSEITRVFTPIPSAEAIIEKANPRLFHDGHDRAYYQPASDSIHLPGKAAFTDEAGYYATLLHELGHWTGHSSRLDRHDLLNPFGSALYAREELRAELASYMVSEQIGIPFNPSNHAGYIDSWLESLRKDKTEILRAAHDAETISTYLIQGPREWQIAKQPVEQAVQVRDKGETLSR